MSKHTICKIISLLIIFAVCFGTVKPVVASENDLDYINFVDEETAYQIAVNFALCNTKEYIAVDEGGDLANHGIEYITEGFPEKFIVSEIEPFYDYSEKVSAYNIKLQDIDGNPCGYIIVNADKQQYPIIEFSYEGTFYMETIEAQVASKMNSYLQKNQRRKYYNGNYEYSVKIEDKYYHLSGDEIQQYSPANNRLSKKPEIVPGDNEKIENEWSALQTIKFSSAPIGSIIINSDNYESGYSNRTADYCVGMPSSWHLMSDFGPGEICSPTAGTNLCYYWTLRDSTYANLKNSNWNTTFSRIIALMGTGITGTSLSGTLNGIRSYFHERGYGSTACYYKTCTSTTDFNDYMKSEINVGRPMLLALGADKVYGNHMVLGVGYVRYMYNGTWSSHYMRIADGCNRSIRYIHYETGRDNLIRIRVVPGV